jgi:hypothetical protein
MAHDYKKKLTCPYCNWKHRDGYEDAENWGLTGEQGETDCEHCGKTFEYEIEIEVKYSTRRINCNLLRPEKPHVFQPAIASVIDQATADRWNDEKFMGRTNHAPHILWVRECENCDIISTKKTGPGAEDPFAKKE